MHLDQPGWGLVHETSRPQLDYQTFRLPNQRLHACLYAKPGKVGYSRLLIVVKMNFDCGWTKKNWLKRIWIWDLLSYLLELYQLSYMYLALCPVFVKLINRRVEVGHLESNQVFTSWIVSTDIRMYTVGLPVTLSAFITYTLQFVNNLLFVSLCLSAKLLFLGCIHCCL